MSGQDSLQHDAEQASNCQRAWTDEDWQNWHASQTKWTDANWQKRDDLQTQELAIWQFLVCFQIWGAPGEVQGYRGI